MKNIHLLPTESFNPIGQQIWRRKNGGLFKPTKSNPIANNLEGKINIYITSDEEIKKGDWYIDTSVFKENIAIDRGIYQMKYFKWGIEGQGDCKKIILTTEQDLIKDGVQSIDDEFLEWFVKNPSCESVETVFNNRDFTGIEKMIKPFGEWKIIIPKEEPKQETLEEAAEKYDSQYVNRLRPAFIAGAKWQQERMYSEEELEDIAKYFFKIGKSGYVIESFEEEFEQFKNK